MMWCSWWRWVCHWVQVISERWREQCHSQNDVSTPAPQCEAYVPSSADTPCGEGWPAGTVSNCWHCTHSIRFTLRHTTWFITIWDHHCITHQTLHIYDYCNYMRSSLHHIHVLSLCWHCTHSIRFTLCHTLHATWFITISDHHCITHHYIYHHIKSCCVPRKTSHMVWHIPLHIYWYWPLTTLPSAVTIDGDTHCHCLFISQTHRPQLKAFGMLST